MTGERSTGDELDRLFFGYIGGLITGQPQRAGFAPEEPAEEAAFSVLRHSSPGSSAPVDLTPTGAGTPQPADSPRISLKRRL